MVFIPNDAQHVVYSYKKVLFDGRWKYTDSSISMRERINIWQELDSNEQDMLEILYISTQE